MFDNGTNWTTYTALDKNTDAWETVTINVPASADFVRLRIQATQDGAGDYAAIDNIILSESATQGSSMTGLDAGTYPVTVTDANGCTATTSATITEPALFQASTVVDSNVSCNGDSSGSVTINLTGGVGPFEYTINGTTYSNFPDSSLPVAGLSAGTYPVTVTDANGCTATTSATITEPVLFQASTVVDSNASCNGDSNGSVTINLTGGVGPFEYTINGTTYSNFPDPSLPVAGLSAGTYPVTVTDANGCTATSSATITAPAAIEVAVVVDSNVNCFEGTDGSVTINLTGGVAPFEYTIDGTTYSNVPDSSLPITGLSGGTYPITITDANGCTATSSVTIDEPVALVATADTQTDVSCNAGTDGSATVAVTGGTAPYTYEWDDTPTGDGTATITDLAAGTYNVTVTDDNGCITTQSFTITEPEELLATADTQTDVSCNAGTDGSATVAVTGGTTPYTYEWDDTPTGDGTATITDLAAGTYNVTVTDDNGCITTQSFTITEPEELLATADTQTDVSCNAGTDGSATVAVTGGTTPYTYEWDDTPTGDGTATITDLAAGTYNVTVTDDNGCITTQSFTITEPEELLATADTQTDVSCNAGTDGSATVAVTGGTTPYTYEWDDTPTGDGTATITDLAAGTYNVTVTDDNGCITTQSFTITEPEELLATADTQTDVSCNAGTDGSATVAVTGGTAPYTYEWDDTPTGDGTATITDLAAGTYNVMVTDDNGCITSQSFTITEPAFVDAPLADAQTFCNFATVADLVATGMNIQWYADETGGIPLASTVAIASGTYYATQTVGDCESPDRTAVEVTLNVTPAPSSSAQTFCNSATVADLTGSGTDLQWYTSASGGTALTDDTALATGTYYVSQTLNSCESARTVVLVTVNNTPAATADAQTFCNAATVADLMATGMNISWYANETGGSPLTTTTSLSTGTYYVTQTMNSCESATRTAVDVTVNVTPVPTASSQIFCNEATVADLVATGSTIQWYTTATGGTALTSDTDLDNGIYYASQTIDGCESVSRASVVVVVNVTEAPEADAQVFCNNATVADLEANGLILQWYADATGGTPLTIEEAITTGTYYVAQVIEGCEGPRTAVDITVNETAMPTADAQTFCEGATVADLVATGDDIQFYLNETGGTALADDTLLSTGMYYVTQTIDDCESPRMMVDVTIDVTASPIAAATQTFCEGATVADLMATGNNLQWYDSEFDGNMLSDTDVLVNGTMYYASQTADGCESYNRTEVIATVTSVATPLGDAVQTFENFGTVGDLVATGSGTITWYATAEDAANQENPLDETTELVDGETYYATQTLGLCTSVTSLEVTADIVLRTDIFTKDKLSYYPVPVVDVLTIENTNRIDTVTVINLLGQTVLTQQVNANTAKIDMSGLQGATYIIRVATEYGINTVKVIKNAN